ncbi:MAG TPA: hypothetical protein VMH30_03705 [Verrucomicrobiae bacterium]|nr:hypothetical protein [Verrucomicrobiae bacterium]
MSDSPDLGLDLENLFQPAWTKRTAGTNLFEKFTGEEVAEPVRRRGERRGPRPEGGERREGRPRSGRKPGGKNDRHTGDFHRGERGERGGRGERRERPEPPAPLPEVGVTFLAEEKGVEQLARQIKMTGRAYPLFQIAQLVLEKPERYSVQLALKKKDDKVVQPLFVCALDDTPWLSEDEAVAHILKNHFGTFYQTERTPTEPPKGTYTFVAQCGMSGVILGPPNYHDYQNQLRKLHTERFSRMPFDVFKARVKIVKDEAVVKKWIEEQSFKTEYTCLNVPEPLKLPAMDEVEKHFRATHKETIVKSVETLVVDGVKSRNLRCGGLYRLVRLEWEDQRRFPLQLAMALSKQFASHGLQFFKVNKTVVHVSVARPQFLDLETTPVSENIKRIVEFINANPKCTRRKLVESLAPTPKPAVLEVKPEEPEVPVPTEPTPEQTALISDLHWLIHQGHVLEFADGRMETAKKPLPRPPKPEKKPAEEKPAAEGELATGIEAPPQTDGPAEPAPDISTPIESAAEGPAPTPAEPAPAETAQNEAPTGEARPTEEVPSPS